jgi:RimJ/RimL family protein N-acetyltransferase
VIPVWDAAAAEWVAGQLGYDRPFTSCRSMAVIHSDRIVAGVVFHDWNPEAGVIELSAAATDPRWMTRKVINEAFGYVFGRLGCQMAVARTEASNRTVRRLWRGLGAQEAIIPRLFGRTKNGAILTLTDDKFRTSKFYQEI